MHIILSIWLLSVCYGTTINVPAESTTIQAGINGAEEGDTVLVAAGTYVENITWPPTNGIKLIGNGEDNCFIDGDSLASVIRFEEDLDEIIDSTTLITGFTIQNGNAQDCGYTNSHRCRGGGLYLFFSRPSFTNVTISDNSAYQGGGIYLLSSRPTFTNVTISDNSATHGGAMYISSSTTPTFTNVIISDNLATYGGGMYLLSSSPTYKNVTISGNSAIHGGGIFFPLNIHLELDGSNPTMTNSILWSNLPEEIYFWELNSASHSITISYSDIQGGEAGIAANDGTIYWGEDNIDSDPLFCETQNGDFTLASNSPCVGTGQSGVNMGALGVSCDEPLSIVDNIIPNIYTLSSYPNPFNPTTTITFTIPEFGHTTIIAYDITGRQLETLANEVLNIGNYRIDWNASSHPSGVYLIRMGSRDFTQTQKVMLVR